MIQSPTTRRRILCLMSVIVTATLLFTFNSISSKVNLTKLTLHLRPDKTAEIDQNYVNLPSKTTGIPKLLHQIWSTDIVPDQFVKNVQGLVAMNPPPEWKYHFWSLERGRDLVKTKYPNLLPLFDNSPDLMKADILRVCIIHQYGGAYFDLDTVAVKPLKPFMENRTCSLVTEPPEHVVGKDMVVFVDYISNAALLCSPGHPFFSRLIKILESQPLTCKTAIQCAGPHLVSHLYFEMKRENNYHLLPKLENYQLFQDVYCKDATQTAEKWCSGHIYENTDIWRRKICDEWIRRGKGNRKLSELAYTYHTWYHVGVRKVTSHIENKISNVVPHAII